MLSKIKEVFMLLVGNQVCMYVCGMIVYDYCYLGYGCSMVVFDVIICWLCYCGYDLMYVCNIIDIDDKIINCVNENGELFDVLIECMIVVMYEDEVWLNIFKLDQELCVIDYIVGMYVMIQILIDKGYVYVLGNGDVYYWVGKFVGYGKLLWWWVEDLCIGVWIELGEVKEDLFDFVFWKGVKLGELSWLLFWGEGCLGWYIECLVMFICCLGDFFDIYGGGNDLEFFYYENEIVQSEVVIGKFYVKFWLYCGMIIINGEKMFKLLGNFFIICEVLEKYYFEVVCYLLIVSYYCSLINYLEENLCEVKVVLDCFYNVFKGLFEVVLVEVVEYVECFVVVMDDDFNIVGVCLVLFELVWEVNCLCESDLLVVVVLVVCLKQLVGLLGVLQLELEVFLQVGVEGKVDVVEVEVLIQVCLEVWVVKNWVEFDWICDQFIVMGVVLEDGKGGIIWCLVD